MGIKFTNKQKDKAINDLKKSIKVLENKIMDSLTIVAEELMIDANIHKGYDNKSGNLSSSIGCGIIKNGSILRIVGFNGSTEGKIKGIKFLNDTVLGLSKNVNYQIVMIAGMYYSTYVENMGYNVLSITEINAKTIMMRELKKIK